MEKGRTTLQADLEAVPRAMPALMRAAKLQKRAEKHGEPQPPVRPEDLADAAARLQSAAPGSPAAEAALGRLLFLAAALGRSAGLDPEQALERANDAFIRDAAHIPTA